MTELLNAFGSIEKVRLRSTLAHQLVSPPVILRLWRHLPVMAKSLKELMNEKVKAYQEEDLQKLQQMSLEELGNQVMKAGREHRGKQFKEIYKNEGYNQWVADHVPQGKFGPGMKAYAHYLHRRLSLGMLGHENIESDLTKDVMMKKKMTEPPNPKEKPMSSKMFDHMEQFEEDNVSDWSRVEFLEDQMGQVKANTESMYQRMGQMEEMMSQIWRHLQKKN